MARAIVEGMIARPGGVIAVSALAAGLACRSESGSEAKNAAPAGLPSGAPSAPGDAAGADGENLPKSIVVRMHESAQTMIDPKDYPATSFRFHCDPAGLAVLDEACSFPVDKTMGCTIDVKNASAGIHQPKTLLTCETADFKTQTEVDCKKHRSAEDALYTFVSTPGTHGTNFYIHCEW